MTPAVVPDGDWPELSHWFGLHPRDVAVPPEQGGLTYPQVAYYLAALAAIRKERAKKK